MAAPPPVRPGIDLSETRAPMMMGVTIVMTVLATIAVGLRLTARAISRAKFWWDDAMAVLAMLLIYFSLACAVISIKYGGVGKHIELGSLSEANILKKMAFILEVVYPVNISAIKFAIVLFYCRLFNVYQGFRRTVFILTGFIAVWLIYVEFLSIFQCVPVRYHWSLVGAEEHCLAPPKLLLPTSIPNVIIDFAILVLPIPIVWLSQMSRSRKIALSAVFMIGTLACAISIVRSYYMSNIDQSDITWSYVDPSIWTHIELSVGLICACLPTLAPLLTDKMKSRLFSLRSYNTSFIWSRSNRNNSSNQNSKPKRTWLGSNKGNTSHHSQNKDGAFHSVPEDETKLYAGQRNNLEPVHSSAARGLGEDDRSDSDTAVPENAIHVKQGFGIENGRNEKMGDAMV